MSATLLIYWAIGAFIPVLWFPKRLGGRGTPQAAFASIGVGVVVYLLGLLIK